MLFRSLQAAEETHGDKVAPAEVAPLAEEEDTVEEEEVTVRLVSSSSLWGSPLIF